MAVGWWTALKVIPWGQVIEHAPTVLKGARRLMERQRGDTPHPEPAPAPAEEEGMSDPREARLIQLEKTVSELQDRLDRAAEQQRQGNELLAALAEQNTRLVAAVDVLRQRLRLLLGAVLVLAGMGAVLAWRVLGG